MRVSRREALPIAAGLCAGAARAVAAPVDSGRTRARLPNVLWLIAEDLGPTGLSCYGSPGAQTPILDRLAREGVRYERCYTTAPVCSPSRSAFMTGMYQTTIGAHHHRSHRDAPFRLPSGVRLLTGWMRDAGYACGNIVDLPEELGFRGAGKTDWNFTPDDVPFDFTRWHDLPRSTPFLAQINFTETHRDFTAPPTVRRSDVVLPPYYPEHPVVREDYARYLDSAAELDRKVGKVLARLKAEGLADTTVVVFMGDNGEAHIRGKQFCYEEGLRVPLIVRWPSGIARPKGYRVGAVEKRLVEAIDLAPTLLSLTGAAIPPRMQGKAFLGPAAAPPGRYAFGARDRCDETAMRLRTVRDARFRYIRNYTPDRPFLSPNAYKAAQYPLWTLLPALHAQGALTPEQAALCAPGMAAEELYDMSADPHQVRNLAGDPAYARKLRELRGVLERWVVDTDDQGRFPEPAA